MKQTETRVNSALLRQGEIRTQLLKLLSDYEDEMRIAGLVERIREYQKDMESEKIETVFLICSLVLFASTVGLGFVHEAQFSPAVIPLVWSLYQLHSYRSITKKNAVVRQEILEQLVELNVLPQSTLSAPQSEQVQSLESLLVVVDSIQQEVVNAWLMSEETDGSGDSLALNSEIEEAEGSFKLSQNR